MSGLAGIVDIAGGPVDGARVDSMIFATPFLGPDGTRQLRQGAVAFIRFELATKPDAQGRFQVLQDEADGLMAVFDGRLDHVADLRSALGPEACRGAVTDCELVAAAYRRWGDGCLRHFAGDYALAVWDHRRRRLFCARSPVGWRPFQWTMAGGQFAFATEAATLVKGLGLPREINEGAIAEYLAARFVSQTDTFWQGVHRLPPGHALALENGQVRTWQWHDGPFEDHADLSEQGHADRFRELFDRAIGAALDSAGPVAAQLSGGLDSSSIVCRAEQLFRAGRLPATVKPFSGRFPGESCDEGEWIAEVERLYDICSEVVAGAPFSAEAMGEWCRQTLHLPLRPNTYGTTLAVCDSLQRQGIRVLLTGEGGDDWLSGTRSHWPDLLLARRWGQLMSEVRTTSAGRGLVRDLRGLAYAAAPLVSRRRRDMLVRLDRDPGSKVPDWIDRGWARRTGLRDRWRSIPPPYARGSHAWMQRSNFYSVSLRHTHYDNVSCYAASRGVELRHPFHDLHLTHFLMGAAGGFLRREGLGKRVLREAMRGTLPEAIRTRTDKAEFSPPIVDGIVARLAGRPLRDTQCVQRGWVDPKVLEATLAGCLADRGTGNRGPGTLTPFAPVWNALSIDLWLENAL